MLDGPMTPRPRRLPILSRSISPRTRIPRTLRTMTEQTFGYYHDPPSFSPFSLQYPQPSFDVGYIGSDNNPFDSDFTNTQSASQNDAPSWSGSFATPDTDGVSFQRRGAVSDAVPEQTGPETGGDTAPRGLRIDTSCGNLNVEHHVQEATANLGSPVNIRSQHLDSATTPTSFPPGINNYETSTPPTNLDMNHRGALPSSLTMSQNSPYYMAGHQGVFDNQQLSHPHSAHPGRLNRQQLPQDSRHYAPSRSPQLLMHPLSAPPYGPSTQNGLSITYTPSSIASSSVRSVSPASTAATSAQPLDFSTYASPVGEYDVSAGECAAPAPSLSSLTLVNGSPHSPVVSVHPTSAHQSPLVSGAHTHPSAIRSSAGASRAGGNHTASPIRRRANKQRLDDARRKEICSYARDRPKARQEDIAIKYGVERSTISKILKHKDKWLSLDTNPRKSIPVKHRPSKFPEIETELLKWVKQCQENGTNITDTRIKAKAKECAAEIGLPEGKFKASSGWIENFKLRNNLTRRSQDEQDASPTQEATEDLDQMDEDEGMAITASQTTQIEADGYGAEGPEQDSFNSMLTVSTDPEPGLLPHETSFSTFSTDSMSSNTQDLSMFHSNTPLSSAASSFASSPSGARPQHVPNDPGLRSRAHSHSVAMRAVGPVGSPQPGAGLIQPMSPARLDMRFTSTPTSASIPRFPSPLSASTSASGNGLVMHNVRHSPASQKHSRHPSDASVFSYDVASQASTDISSIGPPLFEAPSPHQTLEAIDMVLKYFEQPQTAGIASHLDRRTFAEVRQRLAERLVQSLPLSSESGALGPDRGPA